MEKLSRVYTYRDALEREKRRSRIRMKKKIKKTVVTVISTVVEWLIYNLSSILKLLFLLAVAGFGQAMLNKLTFYERGYQAMGGEVFLFPFVLGIGYFILFYLPEKMEFHE